jgi:transglutaminase-like putative cysteine protease
MTILNVRHTTVYRYRRPVRLGDHRLMLRPRDSHDLRLIRTSLNFSPAASVRWVHDVFGNSIAIASFTESAAELRIESRLQLETYVVERPKSEIAPEAATYPFIYSSDDRIDLGHMLECHHPDPSGRLGAWARGFVRSNRTDTLALLGDLNAGVKTSISYQARETEGTQTPIETLNRGWGSCRDLAVLLIEAARCLGFGARIVTGYLYNPTADNGDTRRHRERDHTCVGRYLPAGRRLDRIRPNPWDRRRRQLDTRRCHPRHQPGGSGRRKLCWCSRRLSRHDHQCGGDFGATRRSAFGVTFCLAALDRTLAAN